MSDHVEAALTRSSTTIARKLEFQDILRRFSIGFRHVDHVDRKSPDVSIDWAERLGAYVSQTKGDKMLREKPVPVFPPAQVVTDRWEKVSARHRYLRDGGQFPVGRSNGAVRRDAAVDPGGTLLLRSGG
jgi:hypothetical protein